MVDEINDVRIIGVITAVVMMAVALAGLSWESKVMRQFSLFRTACDYIVVLLVLYALYCVTVVDLSHAVDFHYGRRRPNG